MAIPTGTVLLVATGGVLIYAGFTNRNPLAALRDIASGTPTPVRNQPGVDPSSFTSTSGVNGMGGGIYTASYADVAPGSGIAALPRAAEQFASDVYSQANRWAPGYSDCSSFVGKALKVIGVKPPAGSTTGSYLASSDWKKIPEASVQAGDLAINFNHVVICYGGGYAIGQQNPRVNVQRGRVGDLMSGTGTFLYLRYVAGTGATKPATTQQPKSANV